MNEQNKFPSSFTREQFREFMSSKEVENILDSLGHTLNQKYAGQELILVGVLKGSLFLVADIARRLPEVKVYVDFISLDSHGRDKESQGTITIKRDISSNIADKNILIVEEVIDTARALEFIYKHLSLSNPRSIEVLTFFDKPYQRSVNIKANYIGKQIENQFIIGQGLDLEEYGRNLEGIYQLQFPN